MNRQYTRQASQFRGDQLLRFTPEEAGLIAQAEARHGYSPHQPGGVPGRLPIPAPPVPPDRGDGDERTVVTRRIHHLLLYGGDTLLLDEEWEEGEPPSSSTQRLLEFLLRLSGEEDVDEGEDEDEDEDEEEDW